MTNRVTFVPDDTEVHVLVGNRDCGTIRRIAGHMVWDIVACDGGRLPDAAIALIAQRVCQCENDLRSGYELRRVIVRNFA